MRVTVNGEVREIPDGMDIEGLLRYFDIQALMIAVEHNKKILKREEFPGTLINEGDKIEIIRFVGGG